MNKPVSRFFQCMIALGLATYLAEKFISGRLSFYINMRFAIFTLIGVIGLSIMVVVGLSPIFTMEQQARNSAAGQQSERQKTNLVVVTLLPVIVAFTGLSPVLMIAMYIFVFVLGLTRLNLFNQTDHERYIQHSDIPGTALILLAIPLLLGILVPVRPLSASSLNTRGMSLSAPASIGQQSVKTMDVAPDDRTVLDWIKIFNYEQDVSSYIGKPANVIGFVYHDPRLKTDQFMVGRFAITCCVADAFAIGMAVNWPQSPNLVDNSWVNVKGTVDMISLDEQNVPVINAVSVDPVQAPEQPYLYP
jgi:putative membrane protein